MPEAVIYHNPRCSKSRQTLSLLEEQGVDVTVVEYLNTPPAVAELDAMCRALDVAPLAIMRTKEKLFAELGLSKNDERPRQEWLELMHANPILIERPLVVAGKRVALGRPPESVLEIL